MPLLFALEQHPALVATQKQVGPVRKSSFWTTSTSSLNHLGWVSHTRLFRRSCSTIVTFEFTLGKHRFGCDLLERIAQQSYPDARVWKGAGLPEVDQGLRVLGATQSTWRLSWRLWRSNTRSSWTGSPSSQICSAWSLLLHCASARATYFRAVRPECSFSFVRLHDEGLWRCLCRLLEIPRDLVPHSGSRKEPRSSLLVQLG